jgi:hypothetical protein
MVGINATCISAQVVYDKAVGNFSAPQFVGKSVSIDELPVYAILAVASIRFISGPDPAL